MNSNNVVRESLRSMRAHFSGAAKRDPDNREFYAEAARRLAQVEDVTGDARRGPEAEKIRATCNYISSLAADTLSDKMRAELKAVAPQMDRIGKII